MSDCKFCNLLDGAIEKLPHFVLQTERAVLLVNRRPVAPGHVTIILKQHHKQTSELQDTDWQGVGSLLGKISAYLEKIYQPKRVVLFGDGKAVPHLHFHLIPEMADRPVDLGAAMADVNLQGQALTLGDAETLSFVSDLQKNLVS